MRIEWLEVDTVSRLGPAPLSYKQREEVDSVLEFRKGDCSSSGEAELEGIRLGAWNLGAEVIKTSSKERMETSSDGTA